jgi:cell division protein FtsZ
MAEMGTAMMGTGIASGDERADEAAELAISSPLLEDIDLAGARGILVNITAGMDISIDEFETVGNAVKGFASENATVVVGAVIDPDMTDELRVTVVATGIGAEAQPDIKLVKPEEVVAAPQPIQAEPAAEEDTMAAAVNSQPQSTNNGGLEYLDIPAFLRKQAD